MAEIGVVLHSRGTGRGPGATSRAPSLGHQPVSTLKSGPDRKNQRLRAAGRAFKGLDESVSQKTPLCPPPEAPKGTSPARLDAVPALCVLAPFSLPPRPPPCHVYCMHWRRGRRTSPSGRHELILGATHAESARCGCPGLEHDGVRAPGCIPSKMLIYPAHIADSINHASDYGVRVACARPTLCFGRSALPSALPESPQVRAT